VSTHAELKAPSQAAEPRRSADLVLSRESGRVEVPNEKPKAVFSRTLEKAEWGPTEIFGGDLSAAIAELKARDEEGTVLVHGGPTFAKSLTRLGLIDEYQLHGPNCDRCGPQPICRAGRAPEARRRR
jgi:hypothetical protein